MSVNSLSVFNFESKGIRFETKNDRVWVNLTDMAKASGKRFPDWSRLESTKAYITYVDSVMGFCTTETIQGGQPQLQGTWAIEEVALKFAAWCSVANDVAKVLGYAQPHSTISKLVSSKNKGCADLATRNNHLDNPQLILTPPSGGFLLGLFN